MAARNTVCFFCDGSRFDSASGSAVARLTSGSPIALHLSSIWSAPQALESQLGKPSAVAN